MDFDRYFEEALDGVSELVSSEFSDVTDVAKEDAREVLEQSKERLREWTEQFARGQISKDEFSWLVDAQKDVVMITGLKHVGITPDRVQRLVVGTLEVAVKVAILMI